MFAVADSIGLNCIEVTVVDSHGFDSGTSGCGGDVGASTSKGISFSGQGLVVHRLESMGDVGKEDDLGAMFCPHQQRPRLSDAWKELIKSVGQLFVGGSEGFRDALRKYSIVHSFEFDFVKNETERVTAVCKVKSCKWNIHARLDKKRPVDVVDDLKEYYGVDVSYNRAWLAVQKAKFSAFGDYSDSFNQLQWYRNVVLNLDPRSVFDVEWDQTTNRFLRLFVAFDASVQGFKHCRPVLSVDATFLKARHMGYLMSASAKDERASKWEQVICPYGESRLENLYDLVKTWKVIPSSADIFEVDTDPSVCVDIGRRTCSCCWWQLNGFPCCHAVCAIKYSGKDLNLYVERYFHVESYRQVYSKPIYPVASLLKGDVVDCGTSILPPVDTPIWPNDYFKSHLGTIPMMK
ncbi:hypothetical protein RHGRI_013411 [Rhododendron griersonianum]|uniref:SWIM-type domain-containing protein n=1 Tax=Rhododendron griersonianum TaxID=479676 RepID=A0AAV6K5X5_9ERIC|nr:hypothetical protein RHGRI_013411 [Rhododendron griersonianum]